MKIIVLLSAVFLFAVGTVHAEEPTQVATGSVQAGEQKPAKDSKTDRAEKVPPAPPAWPGFGKAGRVEKNLTYQTDIAPFGTAEHAAMAREILKADPKAQACSEELARAQWEQDILFQVWAPAHFDNCTFDKSLSYIQEKLKEVDTIVGSKEHVAPSDALKAMYALGQALHGVQDFYAHSNYVELQQKLHPLDFGKVKGIDVWREEGIKEVQDLVGNGLVSGRVWWDFPHECPDGVKTHGEMAKEAGVAASNIPIAGWGNRTLYSAALELAAQSSQRYIVYSFERWKALRSACGDALQYLLMVDNRKE